MPLTFNTRGYLFHQIVIAMMLMPTLMSKAIPSLIV